MDVCSADFAFVSRLLFSFVALFAAIGLRIDLTGTSQALLLFWLLLVDFVLMFRLNFPDQFYYRCNRAFVLATTTLAFPIFRVSPVPNCVDKRALFALETVGIAQWLTFLLLLHGHILSDWGSIEPRRIDLFIQCSFLSDLWSILQVLSHFVLFPSLLLLLLHCELKFFSL